ncbi:ISAzo13 family transposase [Pseudofrankia sp. BMG5.37]|nr:ISAzo13 family transposase [Pseudofrankia sp. BMG5.37]MDT3447049.1 ISAzo13 family transposase [Pseudofrankia sp. BMG5.37]
MTAPWVFPHLDERQRRLVMAAEARALGHGDIRAVARAAGVREATVSRGVDELDAGAPPLGRVRRPGGGRKRAAEVDPGLRPALLALVEPDERGDPMSPLRWTTKSTRNLAEQLTRQGHRVGADTVGDLLHAEGFSLQGNSKTLEGAQSPDRDAQFRYINAQVTDSLDAGDPVVSVDTKKKELVGEYANRGRQWRPTGDPVKVDSHDFPDKELGKAVPYGIYDLAADAGWVSVGTDHDTAAFAVASLRRWWDGQGQASYPHARRLLITADAGGSNSYRTRAGKTELAAFALATVLTVTVCHFPPGTSKWNKIEHRLFSHITMNWRGRPLTSHEVIVNSIAATTTRTGLRVHAELDTGAYPAGAKVSDTQIDCLPLDRHSWHGDWNYTLRPEPPPPPPEPARAPERTDWAHPAVTGLSTAAWDELIASLTVPHRIQRDNELFARRSGPPTRRPAGDHPPALTLAEQTLVTVLRLRFRTPQPVLAELFGVSLGSIAKADREIHPLLDQNRHTVTPATTCLATLADLTAHAQAHGIDLTPKPKPAC